MTLTEPNTAAAWEWRATGTTWRIHHGGGVNADLAARAAAAVHADEQRWSRFLPGSEVSRLTALAGAPVPVSEETLDLLEACIAWARRTGEVFQPLVGARLSAWGYRRSLLETPAGTATSPICEPITGRLFVDRERGVASIPAGCALDLGGIAKSWIGRRVADLIAGECNEPSILVDAGGDLAAARGDHLIAVETPLHAEGPPVAHVLLCQGHGVATSGYGRRSWRNGDGRLAHHLIDPDTGSPGVESHATVVATDPVAADVLAKTLALRPERISNMTEAAMVITHRGTRTTPRWDELVRPC
jgi:thiamine biosynthesis lipoprotein